MKYFIFYIILSLYSIESFSQVCTIQNQVILKQEPSFKAETSWIVGKYMPFKVIEYKGSWIKVSDFEGVSHWGLRRNFSTKFTCLVIINKNVRLHKGPGVRFPASEFEITDKYTPYRDLGGEDGWTMVEDDYGNKGFVPLNATWKPTSKVYISY
jgi:hypothetical protein